MTKAQATPNLLQAFDAVLLLNLPDRKDRLQESLSSLEQLDPNARRFVEVVPGVRATAAGSFPSIGAFGCFQAHLAALRLALSRGYKTVLILEDDLRLTHDLHAQWPAVAHSMQSQPWDMLSLGFSEPDPPSPAAPTDTPLYRTTAPIGLSHCYSMQGAAIPLMIAYFEAILTRQPGHPRGGPQHHDGAMYHFFLEHPDAIRLRPPTSLVGQRFSRSDIAGTRWFDLDLPLIRPAVGALRSLRNKLRS